MLNENKKTLIFIFALVLIAIFTHLQWFNPFSILFSWDWKIWHEEAIHSLLHGGQGSYVTFFNFGSANIQAYFNVIFMLFGIVGNYAFASKLFIFIPIAVLSFLAPFFLARFILKDNLSAFLAALYFAFTTTLIYKELAHLFLALSFVVQPLLLLMYIKLIDNFSNKNFLVFLFIFNIAAFVELRMIYISIFILILYALYEYKKVLCILVQHYAEILFGIILTVFVHLFWILPILVIGSEQIQEVANRGLFGEGFNNLFYAFTNNYYSWTGALPTSFIMQPIPIHMWLITIFALSALFFNRWKNKYILFFGAVAN